MKLCGGASELSLQVAYCQSACIIVVTTQSRSAPSHCTAPCHSKANRQNVRKRRREQRPRAHACLPSAVLQRHFAHAGSVT
jgi:hypothetical protein